MPVRVTVWNEYVHERQDAAVAAIYPGGIHGAIADGLSELMGDSVEVRTATLDQERHGLPTEVLDRTDVLLWWGHIRHHLVADQVVEDVNHQVRRGMGLIALHSAQGSKIFKLLMGTSCRLDWRHGDRELLWTVDPGHPIARGVPHPVVIPEQEMYGEFFDIPQPDDLVFVSWFTGGEVFRSGCCYQRGRGKIFYFRPGHETYPTYHNPEVQRVIRNAVHWAAPVDGPVPVFGIGGPNAPLETLPPRN